MQGILLVTLLVLVSLAKAQVWNDQSNGVTIKTLFVPLRKGSTSIPLPDFSKVQPLTTLNLPSISLGDIQQASTISQNFRSKGNLIELNVQSLQDLRPKQGGQSFKSELPNHGSNFPNYFQNHNFPQQQQQQQHNNGPYHSVENTLNHHSPSQQQFYQQESNYGGGHQNEVFQRNNSDFHYHGNSMSNENFDYQVAPHNLPSGRNPNFYNTMNTGQQVYTRENVMNHKIPPSDVAYTHSQNPQHQVHVYDRENSAHHEAVPQNSESSGHSSRYFHQMASDANTRQQPYMSPLNERYLASHHQISYGTQNIPNNQHIEVINHNTNPYQSMQSQENRHNPSNQQLQQPVNTYAVVHQRIPTNSFNGQGNPGNVHTEQNHFVQYKQVSESRPFTETRHSSHGGYINNESGEYIKISPNQEHIPMQLASQNHLKAEIPQNSLENMQYPMKQYGSSNVNNYHYNSHPQVTHVQFTAPQGPHGSSEGQHFQQIGLSSEEEVRNQEVKSNRHQTSLPQGPYPDPTTETFYPENKQVYIAPPSEYGPQNQKFHQQQSMNGQEYVKFSSPTESNGHSQIPISIQTGQLGIHVSIPNKSHSHRDSSNYRNVYA